MKARHSFLDSLILVDHYTRLETIQQNMDQIQIKDIEQLTEMSHASVKDGNLKIAMDLSECAVLCAMVINDYVVLAKVLTVRSQILFAANENQLAIQCALQALNCVRHKSELSDDIRAFFVEHDFDFGVALVDQKIARGLEPVAALNLLNEVRTEYEKRDYKLGLGYVLWSLGDIHKEARYMEEALACYLRAVVILREFQMHIAELLISMSFAFGQLNQLEEAEQCLREAGQIFSEEKNELGIAGVDISRAAFMRRTMRYRNPVRLYRKSYEVYKQYGQDRDAAFVEMNLATLLLHYPGHEDQSLILLKSAIAVFDRVDDKGLANKARGYLASLYYNIGDENQAKELLLPIINGDLDIVPSDTLWQSLYVMGGVELSAGNQLTAYDYYKRGIEIIDSIRSHLRTEELIIDYLNLKPDFYRPLVLLAVATSQPTDALGWVEQAKSRAFLQLLGNARPTFLSDLNMSQLEQLNEMDTQIAVLEKTIVLRQSVESEAVLSRWKLNLSQLINTRENLNRQRKIHNAEAAELIAVQPLDLDELRERLSTR